MASVIAGGPTLGTLMANAARRFANRPALVQGEQSWTFAEFDATAKALAISLINNLPFGAQVCLFMANRVEYLLLQSALERAGLVRVPINSRLSALDVSRIVADCSASVIFCDASTSDIARQVAAKNGVWLCGVDASLTERGPAFSELLAKRSAPSQSALRLPVPEDLCSINYTSGSSGMPKGVMLTHRNWLALTRNMLVDRDLSGSDIVAHVGPLTHSSGTYFTPWFLRGACSVIVDGGIDGLLEAIPKYRISAFTCVPTALTRIVNHPEIDRIDTSSLRAIGYGAEPIPRNTLEKALQRFGPILTQNYGLTEAMMTCSYLSPREHFDSNGELRIGSIGRPYTFVDIVARDPDGEPVAPGEVGELTIRAEHVMAGYWGKPEETAKVLHDGWLWSGDLCRIDESGLITLAGRSKEMLISGGFNIYPQEIEAFLMSIPEISEAAVIGLPDSEWGEVAIAFVSPAPGAEVNADKLRTTCREILSFKTPKRFIVESALPKNANGKVDKKALRARLEV